MTPSAAVTAVDGQDGPAWRKILRAAAAGGDRRQAAAAIHALVLIDPAALSELDLTIAAADIAAALEVADPGQAARVFEDLSRVSGGLDVLYQLVSHRGGSKGALRAAELLRTPEVRARASPALAVALALRDTPCADREALLEAAGSDGDYRTLPLLAALRSPACLQAGCCVHGEKKVEAASQQIAARIKPAGQPAARSAEEPDPYQ